MFSDRLKKMQEQQQNTSISREDNLAKARMRSVPRDRSIPQIEIIDYDIELLNEIPKVQLTNNKSLATMLLEECKKVNSLTSLINFQKVTEPMLLENKLKLKEAWAIVRMYMITMTNAINNEYQLGIEYKVPDKEFNDYDEYFECVEKIYFSLEDQIIEKKNMYEGNIDFEDMLDTLANVFADFSTTLVPEVI